jgi:hypothetical protein
MNGAVVQICSLCWLFLLRLTMHGTHIKIYHQSYSVYKSTYDAVNRPQMTDCQHLALLEEVTPLKKRSFSVTPTVE